MVEKLRALRDGFFLSRLTREDAPVIADVLNDPLYHKHTLRIPYPYTLDDAHTWINLVYKEYDRTGQVTTFAIRNPHEKMIGACGLVDYQPGSHLMEVGYWLAKPYWKKGIVTAAVLSLCDLAKELGAVKISALIFPFNEASKKVALRCEFFLEGTLLRHHKKGDAYLDAMMYSKLL